MGQLPLSSIPRWVQRGNYWVPLSVNSRCPFCHREVTLLFERLVDDTQRRSVTMTATCPSCAEEAYFWALKLAQISKTSDEQKCAALIMWPPAPIQREPVVDLDAIGETKIEVEYRSAVDTYNTNQWAACAVLCRRTLEGIVQRKFPDIAKRNDSLAAQLNELSATTTLLTPIRNVTEALRKGGNAGAHFDIELNPDHEVASLMLDLLDFVVEYIFTLEEKSRSLKRRVQRLDDSTNDVAT